ncbi:MAG: MerR family transcriptional regulator, partial [Gammaproteobacteria bacterium]|nr:MerR family transcriptional regulator [Gammaproteobacteria bacterium]
SKNSFWRSIAIIRTTLKLRRESVTMQGKKKQSSVEIPVKLYRIGEVVNNTPFSRQTIHNYTTMGLIEESSWTKGGHRLYDQSVFERLSMIVELRKTKTLEQIKVILKKC